MAGIERGGMNTQRWPAEADVNDEGLDLPGDRALDLEGEDAGTGAEGAGLAERERLSGLPEHEFDKDDTIGAGLASSGGSLPDYGRTSDQPVPEEDADSDDSPGLPSMQGLPRSGG